MEKIGIGLMSWVVSNRVRYFLAKSIRRDDTKNLSKGRSLQDFGQSLKEMRAKQAIFKGSVPLILGVIGIFLGGFINDPEFSPIIISSGIFHTIEGIVTFNRSSRGYF